jgi:hypothetical protein
MSEVRAAKGKSESRSRSKSPTDVIGEMFEEPSMSSEVEEKTIFSFSEAHGGQDQIVDLKPYTEDEMKIPDFDIREDLLIHAKKAEDLFYGFFMTISPDTQKRLVLFMSYGSYNRDEVVTRSVSVFKHYPVDLVCAIIGVALRGPNKAKDITLPQSKRTLKSFGIPHSGQGKFNLGQLPPAFADVVITCFYNAKIAKRIVTSDCPSALQFWGANGVKLGPKSLSAHKRFAREMSAVIGSTFREQIYELTTQQAYKASDSLQLILDSIEASIP